MSIRNRPGSGDQVSWIIVGLGNPGQDYQDTYHNVGFRVVDLLAGRWGVSLSIRVGPSRVGRAREGQRPVLVQPQTFMNLSGSSLGALFDRFGPDSGLLVISDDISLPLGRIRIRERGSAGGHNGLKSIGSALGSVEYPRVRVGISPEESTAGGLDMREYVLSRVWKSHRERLSQCEQLAADAVETIVSEGVQSAMSRFNGQDLREG